MARRRRKKKKEFPWSMILVAVLTFGGGVALMIIYGGEYLPSTSPDRDRDNGKAPVEETTKVDTHPLERPTERTLMIYYGDKSGKGLRAETMELKAESLTKDITTAVEALLKEPGDKYLDVIPDGTKLLSVEVRGDLAIIDLSKEFKENHPGGSQWELQSIYSVVNTVGLSFDEIARVQILVGGRAKETLAGHIMIRSPLPPSTKAIAE